MTSDVLNFFVYNPKSERTYKIGAKSKDLPKLKISKIKRDLSKALKNVSIDDFEISYNSVILESHVTASQLNFTDGTRLVLEFKERVDGSNVQDTETTSYTGVQSSKKLLVNSKEQVRIGSREQFELGVLAHIFKIKDRELTDLKNKTAEVVPIEHDHTLAKQYEFLCKENDHLINVINDFDQKKRSLSDENRALKVIMDKHHRNKGLTPLQYSQYYEQSLKQISDMEKELSRLVRANKQIGLQLSEEQTKSLRIHQNLIEIKHGGCAVRVLPRISVIDTNNNTSCLRYNGNGSDGRLSYENEFNEVRSYRFSSIIPNSLSQRDMYVKEFEESIKLLFNGFNCNVFTCGQNNIGRSAILFGDEMNQSGVCTRSLETVFNLIEQYHVRMLMKISCIELFDNQVFDLFDNSQIKHLKKSGPNGFFVSGLKKIVVYSFTDVLEKIRPIMVHRTKRTSENSNRCALSHIVLCIELKNLSSLQKSKLSFVDLACTDFENVIHHSDNYDERIADNLQQDFNALLELFDFVQNSETVSSPFKSSILNRVLYNCFQNSKKIKTLFCAALSSRQKDSKHTFRTLKLINNLVKHQ
eukprot:TRINITY_DN2258_c0_g1_i1.p1 TRINITY_DN2258_c0_g1~~TRINITY_DN2258_c0_g1_i1.p1  ORF type:complete len:585 (-),score=48.37 TRINITY_DN2258_c0_g1_i1:146-1900(-)